MSKRTRYAPEVKERAVRMLLEQQNEHPSQWRAVCSITAKLGRAGETPRSRLHQAERGQGVWACLTRSERKRLKQDHCGATWPWTP